MESLEIFISMLEDTLDSKRRRHIVGGILISVSLLFGGLAITTLTMKEEEKCPDMELLDSASEPLSEEE